MRGAASIALALALAIAHAAHAAPPPAPGLLPTEVVRPLLELDPEVAAARSGREAARQEALLLDGSPHEWSAKLAGQRRSLDAGTRQREWNAGIERTLRLPGKADADRRIGQTLLDEGEARYGEALHETARQLLGLWLDWVHAEQGERLAAAHLRAARDNLDIVDKRVKAGDAARLDAAVARAELAEQQRAGIEATTASAVAWARLNARFPGLGRQFSALPAPQPLGETAQFWRERILSQSDELKIAEALCQKAQAHGERQRAEKIPDPTVGVYTASEAGGRERVTGVTLSIALPGGQRGARAARSAHAAEMSRHELALTKRALEGAIAVALATARGAYDGWQSAESGAAAMRDNARLTQRAYALGETDLQSLLAAGRQATTAEQNALTAQVAAARAYYEVLVDAHLVWDMDHD
jgi:outer membrane protein, heavy metal efflux system